jgi:hypothetical protein
MAALAVMSFYIFAVSSLGSVVVSYIPLPVVGLKGHLSSWSLVVSGSGYFCFFAIIGFVLGEGRRIGHPDVRSGARALAYSLAVLFLVAIVAWSASSGNVVFKAEGYIGGVIGDIVAVNRAAGVDSAYLDVLESNKDAIAAFAVRIMPSMVFVYALFTVVINLVMGRRFAGKRRFAKASGSMTKFRMPDYMVWVVIACGAFFFADSYLIRSAWVKMFVANGLITVLALYFFQGLAVIAHVLQGVRFPLLRLAAYVLIILFFQSISVVIVALGLADVWINFRTRKLKFGHQNP